MGSEGGAEVWGRREGWWYGVGRERGRVYEAYEVNNNSQKSAVICVAGKRKILFIYL